jgi:hypothetical protein
VQDIPAVPESAQLERIMQSAAFRTSEIHRALLAYLVEKSFSGEADSLKEYTVRLEVFRKPPSYDPRQESTVRMHIARVRQKLAEYYQTEDVSDPVVIGPPKGAFKISFYYRAATSTAEPPLPDKQLSPQRSIWAIAITLAILERLWEPLFSSARSLIVCLSSASTEPELTALGTADGAFLLGRFINGEERSSGCSCRTRRD